MIRPIRALAAVALAVCCGSACVVGFRTGTKPADFSRDGALVHVYLWGPPRAAGLPRLRVERVALVAGDGGEVPLETARTEAGRVPAGRERLLARGFVLPGPFLGLRLFVSRQDGEGAAGGEPEALGADLAFAAAARQGIAIEVALEARAGASEEEAALAAVSARMATLPAFGALGLVSAGEDDAVILLDKRDGRVGGMVPTGRGPSGLAVDPYRRRAYVATSGDDGIEAIDLEQSSIAERRRLAMGDEPVDLELLPDRRALVVVNRGSETLSFVETDGLAETDRVPVGRGPASLAVDRTGRRAYVFESRGATVSVVDLASRTVVARIPVDPGPIRGEFNRTQDRLWILHEEVPFLTCLDTETLAVVGTLNLGAAGTALRIDPRTDRIYVARGDGTGIDVYDPRSQSPVDHLPLPGAAAYLAIDDETRIVAAAIAEEGRVQAIGLIGRAPVWDTGVGAPAFVRFVGER